MSRAPTPAPGPVPFNKPWKSCADQLVILEGRGLVIADKTAAADFLAHINYYRFSGFCLAFETARHAFVPGTTFEQVRTAYEFDQHLRDLINEVLEVVEVDVRTAIAYPFGQAYGAFGHVDSRNFHGTFKHKNWLKRLRNHAKESNEGFVLHFQQAYSEFPDLPIWMLTEIMSFGAISMMFKFMHKPDQRAVGARYGVQAVYLVSWVHHLVYVRNICAHHARLWDRQWAIKPHLPSSNVWAASGLPSNDRLFVTLLILNQLMKKCSCLDGFRAAWRDRLAAHVATLPSCNNPLSRMGFPAGWQTHPLWT